MLHDTWSILFYIDVSSLYKTYNIVVAFIVITVKKKKKTTYFTIRKNLTKYHITISKYQ